MFRALAAFFFLLGCVPLFVVLARSQSAPARVTVRRLQEALQEDAGDGSQPVRPDTQE